MLLYHTVVCDPVLGDCGQMVIGTITLLLIIPSFIYLLFLLSLILPIFLPHFFPHSPIIPPSSCPISFPHSPNVPLSSPIPFVP